MHTVHVATQCLSFNLSFNVIAKARLHLLDYMTLEDFGHLYGHLKFNRAHNCHHLFSNFCVLHHYFKNTFIFIFSYSQKQHFTLFGGSIKYLGSGIRWTGLLCKFCHLLVLRSDKILNFSVPLFLYLPVGIIRPPLSQGTKQCLAICNQSVNQDFSFPLLPEAAFQLRLDKYSFDCFYKCFGGFLLQRGLIVSAIIIKILRFGILLQEIVQESNEGKF